MNLGSSISLGDILRAFDKLAPGNDHTRRQIQSLLGFTTRPGTPATPDAKVPQALAPSQPSTPATRWGAEGVSQLTPKPVGPTDRLPRLTVLSVGSRPAGSAPWRSAQPLESFRRELHLQGVRWEAPLFRTNWLRGIVAASLSTRAPDGPIDVPALVERMARGETIEELPRLPVPSLRRGVQILVDRGEGMQPFARDQRELVHALIRIVGKSLVKSLAFQACPKRKAGSGPVWTWRPYEPPSPGTPVLLLSDLGMGRSFSPSSRAPLSEWVSFAGTLVRRRCPIIAFVPYPESRWPIRMAWQVAMVPWDRTTSVQTVRKAIGHFLEVRDGLAGRDGSLGSDYLGANRPKGHRTLPRGARVNGEAEALETQASALIELVERGDPDVVELAMLVSIAVRVEPELLRAVRLRLCPKLHAATEADLWFSPLVQSRGHDGIAFLPEVSAVLRKRLVNDPRRAEAWRITEQCHELSTPAIRLEELVTWTALSSPGDPRGAINEALYPALRSLIVDKQEDVARWAARRFLAFLRKHAGRERPGSSGSRRGTTWANFACWRGTRQTTFSRSTLVTSPKASPTSISASGELKVFWRSGMSILRGRMPSRCPTPTPAS